MGYIFIFFLLRLILIVVKVIEQIAILESDADENRDEAILYVSEPGSKV